MAAQRTWARLAARGFAGWDPYDGAAANRLTRHLPASRTSLRLVTQAVKHCPLALQPLLAIPQAVDSYTLGQALLGGARLLAAGPGAVTAPDVAALTEQARAQALLRRRTWAWGYHFPVHTRFFSYGPDTPNLIVTSFVAKGLAAVTRAGVVDCREELRGAAAFIRTELPRVVDESGQCFGYVPGERAVVHNANMLAALVLCEVAELCDCAGCLDDALACARFTIARQSADGSWPYSEESFGRWVDGFHTGFVLEGLSRVVAATGDARLRSALERGVRFYVAQLFGPRGEPKSSPQRAYPLDALSAAQGVETLWLAVGGAARAGGTRAARLGPQASRAARRNGRLPGAPRVDRLAAVPALGVGAAHGRPGRCGRPTRRRQRRDGEMNAPGTVWIDLANSPHVLFFEPVIAELQRRGVDVRVTARDFAQTAALSRRLPVPVEILGSHGGAGLAGKARTLAGRVAQLRRWGR